MDPKVRLSHEERLREKDFLYTVLDLPVFATESDIKDRHRALSLVFHPDKQRDERLKKVATDRFLEIQFAYEILSDAFLREVYDTLGYEGLKLSFPDHLRKLSVDELRLALREFFYETSMTGLQAQVNSRATVTCSLDARELFGDGWLAQDWSSDLSKRLAATKLSFLSLRHTFSKRLGQQTKLQVVSKAELPDIVEIGSRARISPSSFALLRGHVLGVVSHQYSPSKQIQVRGSLTNFRGFTLSWTHEDKLNLFRVSAPLRPSFTLPPVTLTFRRRLFRNSFSLGSMDCVVNSVGVPVVNIGITHPVVAKKESTFAFGWTMGVRLRMFMSGGPVAYAQWYAAWPRLSSFLKVGSELSPLTGPASTIEGSWQNEASDTEVSTAVSWNFLSVVLRLSLSHQGQTFVLPITLADEYEPGLVALATVVPASAFVLVDYFFLRKLRAQRKAKRRQEHDLARLDQLSEKRAEAEAVMEMLKSIARRSLEAEKSKDGLVILEASYFPLEDNGTPMPELGIDVTTSIQALVNSGQLFIPGGRSKSLLRGFYDPLPECAKRLSVRYEFRGRKHYAEVGEHAPLLLPLESHLVQDRQTGEEWSKDEPITA